MKEYVNVFSGEVQKRDFGSSIWKPHCDFEHYEEGTSLTAPDQVESLKSIIARCMRGEALLANSKPAYYDESMSDSEVLLNDGMADLADIPSLQNASVDADGAKGGVEAQSAVDSNQKIGSDSKTQSNESSESKE